MNIQPNAQPTSLSVESTQEQKPVPIEVKWNIPAWMMRHPGPLVEIEDDQLEEEGQVKR